MQPRPWPHCIRLVKTHRMIDRIIADLACMCRAFCTTHFPFSSFAGDIEDSRDDPDYIPDTDSDVEIPPSVTSVDDMPRYPGLQLPTPSVARATWEMSGISTDVLEATTSPGTSSQTTGVETASMRLTVVCYPVAKTANHLGRREWDRRNVCMYCDRLQAKVTRLCSGRMVRKSKCSWR